MQIDVHCHLTGNEFESVGGVDAVIRRAEEKGVQTLVCSGFDLPSSEKAFELSQKYESVYFCAGFQSEEIENASLSDVDRLTPLFFEKKCVAVGEIGLDFHFDDNPKREKQEEFFAYQLQKAHEAKLPVVLHSRDACAPTLNVLKDNEKLLSCGGLMHCYSYAKESVEDFKKFGFYFSFGGVATFKNAKKVHESVLAVGLDRILTETDSPYLSPEPFRGAFPNEPNKIPVILERLALLLGVGKEEAERKIYENALGLFTKIKR